MRWSETYANRRPIISSDSEPSPFSHSISDSESGRRGEITTCGASFYRPNHREVRPVFVSFFLFSFFYLYRRFLNDVSSFDQIGELSLTTLAAPFVLVTILDWFGFKLFEDVLLGVGLGVFFADCVMYLPVGLLVLLVSSSSWIADARHDLNLNGDVSTNEQMCTLCKEFTRHTLRYFRDAKTQTMIINVLHKSCTQALSLKKQCITLVDYYAHIFFKKLSSVKPRDFCRKVNLCERNQMLSWHVKEEKCDLCRQVVSELLGKLKNPDTQILLKACNSAESSSKKCERIDFEYGPLILGYTELFLETRDICMTMHACGSSKAEQHIGLETSSGHSSS
ncbi:hypothetical protein MLD38_030003 [Melastoma candidum]|uniref:Uncharacterized protein n=1 Tax=Melastoma candidum TaxID=119954 RepID=A0ACB9MK73_9MYRT|nr:hypothetical protein MLD38_030003 [Melastoma candidum]